MRQILAIHAALNKVEIISGRDAIYLDQVDFDCGGGSITLRGTFSCDTPAHTRRERVV
jgi:hypothetical protein